MSVESLIDYLATITDLSVSFQDNLRQKTSIETYGPHQVIHASGQVENRVWFIHSGFARAYYFDQAGKEHTLHFYTDKDIIFSYNGYWRETSDYYLEILEQAVLISLSYDYLTEIIDLYPEARRLVNIYIRQRFHQEVFKNRLMNCPADERYKQFRKVYPYIFQKASVRLISSYLNMSRENLSRLMGREH